MAGGTIMYISEESAAVARKTVKCHQGNRFFALLSYCCLPLFPQSIPVSALDDRGMEVVIMTVNIKHHYDEKR